MKNTTPNDPKGLIRESIRIEGITAEECRSIFVDWALSVDVEDHTPMIEALLIHHADEPIDHPMKTVLQDGLAAKPKGGRRGGRAARVAKS